jgi:hypothetical protein
MDKKKYDNPVPWDLISTEIYAASGRVCQGPAYLFAVHLTANSSGVSTADVYDGHSTGGQKKVALSAFADGTDPRAFYPPILFNQGIYLDAGSNVDSVMVQYLRKA